MDFFDVISQRYSVRAYKPDAVEEDKLKAILEAAALAPTAANLQPFRVIVIHTAGRKDELLRIYGREWFSDAPLVICVAGVKSEGWTRRDDGKSHIDVDATIVMDHIILTATALGLGTCWIGAFNPTAACEVLGLPEGVEPIVFTPLGYPNDQPRVKNRKPVEDIVKYERW